jgi:predicted metal-dependent enzyme (double-stranded beta helix superfamily)
MMTDKIEQLGRRCHDILMQGHGPEQLEQVRQGLEAVLVDEDVVTAHLGPDADEPREIIYEDPELEFCILAHVFKGVSESPPHDHGPTWAIYGQVAGTTEMTEYRMLAPAEDDSPGKAEPTENYRLAPGMAVAYEVGQIHSPKRVGETRLIRIEGKNVTKLKRATYEVA